jgi:hypothetical protein
MTAAKAWVAALGMVVTSLSAAFADDVFNGSDAAAVVSTVVLAIVSVIAVYQVENKDDKPTQPSTTA